MHTPRAGTHLRASVGDQTVSIVFANGRRNSFNQLTRPQEAIIANETALYLNGISDRTPFEHTVTAPSGCIPSAAIRAECKIYYIKPELFDLGKTVIKTPAGNDVSVYDMERTICDIIRSRNKLGTETFLAALKLYASNPKKDLNKLASYAKELRVANVLRQYLEVLL